jgi:putative endonuclease
MKKVPRWFLYIVRCGDGTLYTGITTDVNRRLAEHREKGPGGGAKYLRGRGPLKVVYTKKAGTRSKALKMEFQIKKMTKGEKEKMIRMKETIRRVQIRFKVGATGGSAPTVAG